MGKKRSASRFSGNFRGYKVHFNIKAQVTVFIIIGLLLLFAFIFVMSAYSSTQKTQLQGEQERLTVNLFKKEAMRIYVEDCLQDSLEQGLIMLGQQGQIWDDQPGGNVNFNDVTGTPFEDFRIYYGISNEKYLEYLNAYPCNDKTDLSPYFCKYIHPNIQVGFGNLNLKIETIRRGMEGYLINQTILCVENFTKSNFSKLAKIETTNISLIVDIQEDGIAVKADYPLKFSVGKEEFFQLTTFDFFYPSQFKKLLDSAVTYALERDSRFLDFNYTQEFLASPEYTAYDTYNSLGIKTIRSELSNGDDVFTFAPDIYTVLNTPYPYYFRLARQNRPPALDYVQRYGCPEDLEKGYDYLAIQNDNSSLAEVNLTLYALDPDEDTFTYLFEDIPAKLKSLAIIQPPEQFYMNKEKVNSVTPGPYPLTVKATDEHGLEDWQDVRLLIDRPIDTNLSLRVSYDDINGSFGEAYLVSTEDPVFVNISYPGKSLAKSEAIVTLNYTNKEGTEAFTFDYPLSSDSPGKNCFSLPWGGEHPCDFGSYKSIDLSTWKKAFEGGDQRYNHFQKNTSNGKLNLSFSITYCGGLNKSTSVAAQIIVKECLPHRNPQRPFAYPYQNYVFSSYDFENHFGNFSHMDESNSFNPLEATHSCCIGSPTDTPTGWRIADNTTACFVDPIPGCYGKNKDYLENNNYGNRILEIKTNYCNGTRGNVCLGNEVYSLYKDTLICGNKTQPECGGIAKECEGKLAFSITKYNGKGGWCHGNMGCSKFETLSPIVYKGGEKFPPNLNVAPYWASDYALAGKYTTDINTKYPLKVGCDANTVGSPCDSDYNGLFAGKCNLAGDCEKDH
ncbi:MAG: hypothetical protein V2A62_05680 [Candidatus Woesearchaeota archaeon]